MESRARKNIRRSSRGTGVNRNTTDHRARDRHADDFTPVFSSRGRSRRNAAMRRRSGRNARDGERWDRAAKPAGRISATYN